MSKIIAIANQKGGVGKTTTCVNLAASLAATQRRVLMVDLDPQGNATMGSGVDKGTLEHTVCDVLLDDLPVEEALQTGTETGYDLLPANQALTAAEIELLSKDNREHRLRRALEPLAERYDYILIDCPPAINMLTVNALVAADSVLIPMQCEYYALEGLTALLDTVDQISEAANPRLDIHGILRTMFDPRNNLANEVSSQLMGHFGDRVYRTVIPRNVRLAEAPSFGLPVLLHDKYSRGALAYLALAGEINRRETISQPGTEGGAPPQGAPEPGDSSVPAEPPATADAPGGQAAAQSDEAPESAATSESERPSEPESGAEYGSDVEAPTVAALRRESQPRSS